MKEEIGKRPIREFRDLVVYKRLYQLMILVMQEITPRLPVEERYDLRSQMNRACKAPPALLAEGFAKRYQPLAWKKYINDSIGESYEMINHLSVCIDVYAKYVNREMCLDAIEKYTIACKQLYRLREGWKNFHR